MKKNLLILTLAIISILSLSFAYVQKIRADESKEEAIQAHQQALEMMKLAEAQRRLAEQHRQMAEASAMEALRQKTIADEMRVAQKTAKH